jgi:hypothetical protein
MKGEMIMNRFSHLLFTTFVVAVMALSSGINVTCAQQGSAAVKPAAEQDPAAVKPAAEQDPAAAQRAAAAAVRARAQRDAAVKRRHEAQKYIQKVVEGQQPGTGVAAPDKAGKEGAK